jgi:hypothetical protein
MPIERERLALGAEYAGRFVKERPSPRQLIDRRANFKSWVDADEWLGPESIARVNRFNLLANVGRPNWVNERANRS